ncbi:MAG: ABC transporter substrate-binding protein [Nitrospirae bacterium]|nr:ABC transporter substrate-binding protein [Nitrospirota bacterium]
MKYQEQYPEIPATRADDLHNLQYADDADLVLFMAGNQFMVMDELLAAFRKRHPEVKKIFYETLPPGLEFEQIKAGGAVFKGRVITGRPDIYTSVTKEAMEELQTLGLIKSYHPYLHNRIVLITRKGNPANIKKVTDLARSDVRISQPGAMENITTYILDMYEKAGGKELVHRIMEEKRAEGTTILTIVHHRETPLRLKLGTVDVGPVWSTEAVHALKEGLDIEIIEPGEELDQRDAVTYYVARLKDAPNPENASRFLDFILSDEAQSIYESYGFIPLRSSSS